MPWRISPSDRLRQLAKTDATGTWAGEAARPASSARDRPLAPVPLTTIHSRSPPLRQGAAGAHRQARQPLGFSPLTHSSGILYTKRQTSLGADCRATEQHEGVRRMIRTGDEYRESIRDGREVWIAGERVHDVTTHPMFKPIVDARARIYDMAHEAATRD